MLVDRYDPEDVFARVPEVAAQTDPVLKALDRLLEDDQLYRQVRADLGKRYRFTLVHGRHSTPVEVLLRMLLCKHLYQWGYRETEERVKDSLVLRWFCRVYFEAVPDETTRLALAAHTTPSNTARRECPGGATGSTSQGDQRAQAAARRQPSVQTTIHHPTD